MRRLAINGGPAAVSDSAPVPWPVYTDREVAAVADLVAAGDTFDYGRGGALTEFETRFSDHLGTRFAIGMSSGTSALHSAYASLVDKPGCEIVVPAYGFHATVAPVFLCNAVPVLCDVDPVTGNLDPNQLPGTLNERTRAVVVSHMWGHPADMDSIESRLEGSSIALVEDCSHAHGSTYKGRVVGGQGRVSAMSLGARKMISGGLGGVLGTNDAIVYERAILLGHNHERSLSIANEDLSQRAFTGWGANHRITPVSAALCLMHLDTLETRIEQKRRLFDRLSDGIRDLVGIEPPFTHDWATRGAWYGYKMIYRGEDFGEVPLETVLAALQAEGVDANRPTNRPFSWLPGFQTMAGDPGYYNPGRSRPLYTNADFPGANEFYRRSISLPAPVLSEGSNQYIDQYIEAFAKVFADPELLQPTSTIR